MKSIVVLVAAIVVIVGVVYFYTGNKSASMTETISLTSAAFQNGESIPSQYTCDGANISPALSWSGVPEGTESLTLIMDDPDIPDAVKESRSIKEFDHWTLFNISPTVNEIAEGRSAGTTGANGAGQSVYTGPCPPPQYEPSEHRYFFRLYALDDTLSLSAGAAKADVLTAMDGHVLGNGELIGKYKRIVQ